MDREQALGSNRKVDNMVGQKKRGKEPHPAD